MSYPSYPEYKASNVEWLEAIPEHWKVEPLFTRFSERRWVNRGMKEDNLLSLSYGAVVRKNIDTDEGLLPESFETYQLVFPDDLIFRLTDLQNDKRSLRSAISTEKGIITSAYLNLVPRKCDAKFAHYLFRSYDLMKVFYAMGSGLRQSLKYSDIKRLPVVLPPPQEQTQIARFLDHQTARIDALIAEQQRLIELLKEKRQAVISHAVTKGLDPDVAMKDSGVEWLGDIPEHWGVTRLKYASELIVDCPHETPSYDPEGDFLVIRTADIENGVLDPKSMYRLNEHEYNHRVRREPLLNGDIVYGREGERWGHAAIVPKSRRYALGQRMMQIRPAKNISSRFLMWMLNSRNVYRQGETDIVGATSPHINISTITNYTLACPPLSEQEKVAQFLAETTGAYDSLIAQAEHTTNLLYERRSALISGAVTGKIDVRDWEPPVSETFPESTANEEAPA